MTFAGGFPKPTPRKAPLKPGQKRRKWLRAKRPRRLDTAQSNPAFLAFVHGEPCCLASDRCAGRIEAHHAGRKPGIAMKAPDDTCVPLCSRHHGELTAHRGAFAGMSKEALRALSDDWIAATYGRYLAHGSRRGS